MNVLSLFDGISCGQLALKEAGIKVTNYFASEIDKHAIAVTQANFPNTIQIGDVREVRAENLPKIDLLIAGSPCTSLSFAGKMQGFDGESGLYFEFLRILKETNPTYFLLENVKTKKEWLDIITNSIGVKPIFIDSAHFSAQKRKRMYWTNIPVKQLPEANTETLQDILDESAPDNHYLLPYQIERGVQKHKAQVFKNTRMGQVKFPTPKTEKSKCLNTVRIKGDRTMTHIQDEKGIRLLTINEYERLQTLPLGYTASAPLNQRFKAIGNSWTVNVISHIFKGIYD